MTVVNKTIVAFAQQLVNAELKAQALKIDGVWGRDSAEKYNALSGSSQSFIREKLRKLQRNMDLDQVFLPSMVITTQELNLMYQVVASKMASATRKWGIPLMQLAVELENYSSADGSILVEHNGTFKGIGQFDAASWATAMPGVDFLSEIDNPVMGLTAIVNYALHNKRVIHNKYPGAPWDHNIAYAAHNQGAGKILGWLGGNAYSVLGDQSSHADRILSIVYNTVKRT